MNDIAIELAKKCLRYDPDTGIIIWTARPSKNAMKVVPGKEAGCCCGQGYKILTLNRKIYGQHQIAWLLHYGEWPQKDIDHINLNKSDNRIKNLRLATNAQNHANIAAPRTNTAGKKGVTLHKPTGKWQAQIRISGKSTYLGLFKTVDDAHNAYVKAATAHFGEYARAA